VANYTSDPKIASLSNQFKETVPKLITTFKEYLSTQSETSLQNFVKLVQDIDNKSFDLSEHLRKAQEKEQAQNMEQIAKGTPEAAVPETIWLKIVFEEDIKVMKIPRKINFVDFQSSIKQKLDVTMVTKLSFRSFMV
jgi:succinate dehydrogenase flavin-adding protein (antitoxin of CptAB toxin-antitoxin module)